VKRSIIIAVAGFMLVASGCAASETGVEAASDTDSSSTTIANTEQPTTTLVAENTTSTLTDTTVASEETTTTMPGGELTEAAELLASLETMGDIVSGRMEGSIELTGLEDDGSGLTDMKMLFSTAFDAATGNSSFLMDMSSLDGAIDLDSDDLVRLDAVIRLLYRSRVFELDRLFGDLMQALAEAGRVAGVGR